VFKTDIKSNFNDITFFASNSPLQISGVHNRARLGLWVSNHEVHFPDDDGLVLTDDFNPLDSIQVRKAELYRKYMVERVGLAMLMW